MKKIFFVAAIAASLVLTSCGTSKVVSTARTAEPMTAPLVADLQVSTGKVTGTFKIEVKKNAFVNEKELMNNAVYEALKNSRADVLVAPLYQVVTDVRGRKYINVTVTGYPATYTNFRPASEVRSMELTQLNDNSSYMITTKDERGVPMGYQVVVPVSKDMITLDMDQTDLEKVVLKPRHGAKAIIVDEPENNGGGLMDKLGKKVGKKSKK